MELHRLTSEDINNIEGLLMDPINLPTYKNSERIRNTFHILLGITIFELFIYLLLSLLGSKAKIIFWFWLAIYILFLLFYKLVHIRFVKKLPKYIQRIKDEQTLCQMTEDSFLLHNKICNFSEINYIVHYKKLYFIFYGKSFTVVKPSIEDELNFKNAFFNFPDIIFEEEDAPFLLKKYLVPAKSS